jgi:hypothetical protein
MCFYFAMQHLSYHNPTPWPVFIQQNDLNIGPGLEINMDAIPVIMTGGSLNLPVTAECYAGHCHSLASFSPHLSRDS